MKAIETIYNNYRFRSRLEARWAVFFDALHIEYRYEPEGFDLEKTGRYLPDFWLPKQKCWIEIKGTRPDDRERDKAEELARLTGTTAYIEFGDILIPDGSFCETFWDTESALAYFAGGGGDSPYRWCECAYCGYIDKQFDGRAARLSCGCYKTHEPGSDKSYNYASDRLRRAYTIARQARFEHGETPRTNGRNR